MSNSPQVPSSGPSTSPKPPASKFTRVRRWWMELFGVRFMNPNVSESVIKTCDRYGEDVIGTMLAGGFNPSTADLQAIFQSEIRRQDARDWLTERNSIREYRERWIPLRDLILELVIIGLIGGEIYLAIEQGKQQSQNFDKQQQVLTNLHKSSEATVHALDSAVQSLNQLTTITDQQAKKFEDYQKQALAKPDLALGFVFIEPTAKTVSKHKLQTIVEYRVPYGRNFFFLAAIKNVTSVPAHKVRIFWGIGPSDKIESIEFVPPQPQPMIEVNSAMAGFRLFERDEDVLYPGVDWQIALNLRIKSDTPDGFAQMFLNAEGGDLTHLYQQWAVFHKKSVSDEGK